MGRKAGRKRAGINAPHGTLKSGPCESCGDHADPLNLDHNHSTGDARGWLCRQCNLALGLLKDDPVRILKLHNYINKAS